MGGSMPTETCEEMDMTTRMRVLALLTLLAGAATLTGCGGMMGERFYDYEAPAPRDLELLTLARMMTGSFSSAEQAAADADYHDIRLEVVQIWPLDPDGVWLYVEQAAATSLDQPYRQRVYHLTRDDETVFDSDIYLLNDEAAWTGLWREPARADALTSADIALKEGCTVKLERVNGYTFEGKTQEADCPSELQGASYATTEVTITPTYLKSWDRGYSADNQQVWGAEKGAYVFVKKM
jgi:hypothetical protein